MPHISADTHKIIVEISNTIRDATDRLESYEETLAFLNSLRDFLDNEIDVVETKQASHDQ